MTDSQARNSCRHWVATSDVASNVAYSVRATICLCNQWLRWTMDSGYERGGKWKAGEGRGGKGREVASCAFGTKQFAQISPKSQTTDSLVCGYCSRQQACHGPRDKCSTGLKKGETNWSLVWFQPFSIMSLVSFSRASPPRPPIIPLLHIMIQRLLTCCVRCCNTWHTAYFFSTDTDRH